jgi:ABC-type polysaccharide/polyol phosphate export permease
MMEKYKISRAMRFFFLVAGSLLWVGIWLTGFTTVHWLLYIPAVFFLFAAATGICPGMIVSNLLFGKRLDG